MASDTFGDVDSYLARQAKEQSVTARLTLSDGEVIEGLSFGAERSVSGEVVFNTGMVGYPESLTDPSYRGQLLVLTYPLVGNYGVPSEDELDEFGLRKYFESEQIHISGLIIADYSKDHSHCQSTMSLSKWLIQHDIPAIHGVDTRELTKKLRNYGSMLGKLEFPMQSVGDGLGTSSIIKADLSTATIEMDNDHCFSDDKLILNDDEQSRHLLMQSPPSRLSGVATHLSYESIPFSDPNQRNLTAEVSRRSVWEWKPMKEEETTEMMMIDDESSKNNDSKMHKIIAIDCGMKNGIIRYLCRRKNIHLKIVPWDYDFLSEDFDGLFVSNGPGDPTMVGETISNLRRFITNEHEFRPLMGICLGNQILALAAGGSTYKMKFGNRGMNQPVIDLRTSRCYITAQNHGFAVDDRRLPVGWKSLFTNGNDSSNEGIIHSYKPWFSVQFHPEAQGGPTDTDFLFNMFLDSIKNRRTQVTTVSMDCLLPLLRGGTLMTYDLNSSAHSGSDEMNTVLLLGSGGLSIGQAGEFDYSGSQAIKALKEENVRVVLINPNIATVQTSQGMADEVYFLPVTPEFVTQVIRKERPNGILLQFGGQTALNCGIELDKCGILRKYNVTVLGTPIATIETTEDRGLFAQALSEVGEKVAPSGIATTVEDAVKVADGLGYPVLLRSAFALGGLGSGFASNRKELSRLATKALCNSTQVIIDKSLRGWKEVEYEVVRDAADNCITVCNMENFDPLGIHTGDSIVVAPSQTLSNGDYFRLRSAAIKIVRHLGVVGECNIQYALDPDSDEFSVIEVNARLSRSSALASKATGYPLAYVAAKLALGKVLPSIRNSITRVTQACFEPALDYCVVKIPRWDLKKFDMVDFKLGSAMKSVGEVMAIDRTFESAMSKALRMVNDHSDGFGYVPSRLLRWTKDQLDQELALPSDLRVYAVALAFRRGYTVDRVFELTRIDRWFLCKLRQISGMEKFMFDTVCLSVDNDDDDDSDISISDGTLGYKALSASDKVAKIPAGVILRCKQLGFSDVQIARVLNGRIFGTPEEMARFALIEPDIIDGAESPVSEPDLTPVPIEDETVNPASSAAVSSSDQPIKVTAIPSAASHTINPDSQTSRTIVLESDVRAERKKRGVIPVVKQIDTLAAEYPAVTNYLYCTYSGTASDITFDTGGIMVLGCGAYRIGSSCEFDWCAVSAVRTLKRLSKELSRDPGLEFDPLAFSRSGGATPRTNGLAFGDGSNSSSEAKKRRRRGSSSSRNSGVNRKLFSSIVVNFNPETVSTDFDECDRLYFEELSLERVLDIYELEWSCGVIVSVGGQASNNLAMGLSKNKVRIFGTQPDSIDQCENRHRFSELCDRIHVDQPAWCEAKTFDEALRFANKVSFPVLIRPSYVLSGAAMNVVHDSSQLKMYLEQATNVSREHPVVVSKFIRNSKEIEFDAVAIQGTVLKYAISEHVENAGVHSGDATLILPAQNLYIETIRRVVKITEIIAKELKITGPFNIQYLCKDNDIKVIECNLRASRSFPFISKTLNLNFIDLATRAMLDDSGLFDYITGHRHKRDLFEIAKAKQQSSSVNLFDFDYVCVKSPMFSFTRLNGADPILSVEMSSTGEVACFGANKHEALLKSMMSAKITLPVPNPDLCESPELLRMDYIRVDTKMMSRRRFDALLESPAHMVPRYGRGGRPSASLKKYNPNDDESPVMFALDDPLFGKQQQTKNNNNKKKSKEERDSSTTPPPPDSMAVGVRHPPSLMIDASDSSSTATTEDDSTNLRCNILLSVGGDDLKYQLLSCAQLLAAVGFQIYATEGTFEFLKRHSVRAKPAPKPSSGLHPNCLEMIHDNRIAMVINIPNRNVRGKETDGYALRRKAVDSAVPLVTDVQLAKAIIRALARKYLRSYEFHSVSKFFSIKSWREYLHST